MNDRHRVVAVMAVCGLVAATFVSAGAGASDWAPEPSAVRALFDPQDAHRSPWPSDVFTVPDNTQLTQRRLHFPRPDCSVRVSDCEDLDVVDTLDGFGLQPQLSIPFDGAVDVSSVDDRAVLLINLGSTVDGQGMGSITGIRQIVWDTFSQTLLVEPAELLNQHTRYALIATNRLRDMRGGRVRASEAFERFRQAGSGDHRLALLEGMRAARRHGIRQEDMVAASVFTTQSITPVMERVRDQIRQAIPEPANFLLGPAGERAVFRRADVAGIAWRQQTAVSPVAFTTAQINLQILQAVPGAVDTIAYGYYVSPDYTIHPGEYMPAVGTRTGIPAVQGHNRIFFTLFLPSGAMPPAGWPVAIAGNPGSGNQHQTSGIVAAMLASHGIATISINNLGTGFGPLSTLTVSMTNGTSLTIPDEGRGIDQNGDGLIGSTEGTVAAAPRSWTIQERDSLRQTAIDLLQLVRVIERGVDVDGDTAVDLDADRIYFHGVSGGGRIGAMLAALEPRISATVLSFTGGLTPETDRLSPARRFVFGALLARRTPALINAPGRETIDGVAVLAPFFDENKPARHEGPVINTVAGAVEIQKAFEIAEMTSQSGLSPVVWARHLRQAPLAGAARSVLLQSAETDQIAVTPGVSAMVRAGALADVAVHYRHDLAYAEDPTIPTNPHTVLAAVTNPNALYRSVARGLLDQVAVFFTSGGTIVTHPEPARFFEVPIRTPVPEELRFIK